MPKGEIIVFRNHGEFRLGLKTGVNAHNLMVLVSQNKTIRVNPQQLVYCTDCYLETTEFELWQAECDKLSSSINLLEIWELVQGIVPFVTIKQLYGIIFGDHPDVVHPVSLVLALYRKNPYFQVNGDNCIPNNHETVEEFFVNERRQRDVDSDRENLINWLQKKQNLLVRSHRQHEWINGLRMYAIHGERYETKQIVKGILRDTTGKTKDLQRHAFELLVGVSVFHEDEPLNLYRYGMSFQFPTSVIKRAKSLSLIRHPLGDQTEDFTDSRIISIDESTTKDVDDALSLDETTEGFILGIHIADASMIVPFGDVVDVEASQRMATLYFPEATFPMLPQCLSEGAGSLLPNVPRRALSILVYLDFSFNIISWKLQPSVVKNSKCLSYKEVDAILAGQDSSWGTMLGSLQLIAKHFHSKRISQGAIEIIRPELKIGFDKLGTVRVEVPEIPTPARRLVAEFMVLANSLIANFCKEHKIPAIYRSQETIPLDDFACRKSGSVLNYLLIRRLRPSSVGLRPLPHALLGLPVYLQATSPLRRYPDLVMQRQLQGFLESGQFVYSGESLQLLMYRADLQIREIGRLEENRKRYWLFKYLSNNIGSVFLGIVLEIEDNKALFEIERIALRVDCYTREHLNPGDEAYLELKDVDLWKLEAQFNITSVVKRFLFQ